MDRRRPVILGAAGILLLAVVWEVSVWAFGIPNYVLPSVSGILVTTAKEWRSLLDAGAVTVFEVIVGMGIGTALGVTVAIALVIVPYAKGLVLPPLVALNSVPSVAYAPLAQLWFGVGAEGKIFMVAFIVSYTILLNTLDGLERVDAAAVNLLRSFGASKAAVMWRLRLPSAAAATATGIRVSVVRAMIIAVVTEMLGAYRGLGWVVFQSAQQVDFLRVWAAVLAASAASLLLFAIVSSAERRLIFWRQSVSNS